MISGLIAACLALGTAELTVGLGGATPLGVLEFGHQGGVLFSAGAGLSLERSLVSVEAAYAQLPGRPGPDYALTDWRGGLTYEYALVRRVDWRFRAGLGLDLHYLSRRIGSAAEHGSVPGARLQFTYLRSFGQPRFLLQVFGIEMLEGSRLGNGSAVQTATLVGAKLGVACEF